MKVRPTTVWQPAFVLIASLWVAPALLAQTAGGDTAERPVVALYELSGQKTDPALHAALYTVADSVELDLACLQRFEVRRLPAVDPSRDMASVRSYCRANRVDQAILGSGSSRAQGGYTFRLLIYDRQSDSITLSREGTSRGALDMFDTTDALVAALLDKLSGTHLLFGSLTVQTDPAGAAVSINGKEVGPSPVSLRGLPVGEVIVSARLPGWEESGTTVKVEDNQVTDATLSLARSLGRLRLDMPQDASVTLRAAGIPDRTLRGPSQEDVPSGRYVAEARCEGLDLVRQPIDVVRNGTAQWTPWPGAYLAVNANVDGATVTVDGVEKGTTPLVLEMDPRVLHHVELHKDNYEPYRAELGATTARKVSFRAQLLRQTGVQVTTTPPGVTVWLDDGKTGAMVTPCRFDNVAPGVHTISARQFILNRRWYTLAPPEATIDVKPEQQAVVSLSMVPGTARLQIDRLPPSATVLIEGEEWKPGREVPAGMLDILVKMPSGQHWQWRVLTGIGTATSVSLDFFYASLPALTIAVDGKVDDWEGIEPLWTAPVSYEWGYKFRFVGPISSKDPFPGQSGTLLKAAFLCKDEHDMYVRMDFSNGAVGMALSDDIKDTLVRDIHCALPDGRVFVAEVSSSREAGVRSRVSIWDPSTKTETDLGPLDAYAVAGSTLEFAIPLSWVQKYLPAGPLSTGIDIADAGSLPFLNGPNAALDWASGGNGLNKGYQTNSCSVDFWK